MDGMPTPSSGSTLASQAWTFPYSIFLHPQIPTAVNSGMKLLDNVEDDDIFLLLDADELPNPESLMFLKPFDG